MEYSTIKQRPLPSLPCAIDEITEIRQDRNMGSVPHSGRTIKRHLRQEELDRMREASRSARAKRDIKTRQHLMERSFARGTPYGYDRARWRGLWRVQIQEYLISAIQNIQVLLKYGDQPKKCISVVVNQVKGTIPRVIGSVSDRMKGLMITEMNRIISTGFVSTVSIKG